MLASDLGSDADSDNFGHLDSESEEEEDGVSAYTDSAGALEQQEDLRMAINMKIMEILELLFPDYLAASLVVTRARKRAG